MSPKQTLRIVALLVLVAALAAGSVALAQTSVHYNLDWHTVAGGGQPVASLHYAVNASAGQGAASPPQSTSLHYAVSGGYWYAGMVPLPVYLPLVLRGAP
jgi:hypothetical protein